MKKFLIKTWGCQMNVYDSARMAEIIARLGYKPTEDVAEADLVILNTCHIREKATDKLFSELGRINETRKERAAEGKMTLIAVAGCVAQGMGEEILRRAPYVNLVFGTQSYHKLPELLAKEGRVLDTDFPPESKFDFLPEKGASGISDFVAVQEGCDKFCSYCVVPYTRGAEYSRPFEDILSEVKALAAKGAREIVFLGQNVNALRGGLGKLLRLAHDIPDILRLRYTTSHPLDMDEDLISAHRELPKLMPFLHLPAQSGSDKILDTMNRKHTADHYKRVIEKLRTARPDLAVSSDFIVGFPGESDADFADTIKLVEEIGYAQAFSFKYSRRHGTPAATMAEQVPEKVKNERLAELQKLLRKQQESFNRACSGKEMSVLFEGLSDRKGFVFGRSPYMQGVFAKGGIDNVGCEIKTKIEKTSPNSLTGSIL